ncbi:Amidohydro_2 domain containing protein [Vulcanisaeta moutnovskia 768-28]|uniref:Amidohydro_2 domain containing protein n=1 Tax=Vulcanisaeta moutnovskia (strain 768-28) TaxID=985053 RepID=F0QSR7_VULM7|nr:amidohydrolase family protein [Vulcanisaeta moutnovskia]ADY01584.1 Amidohydro_2 domain containing protein [Vulcanisaeta moutnovskia 768-28]
MQNYYFIDFHVHPAAELIRLRNKLHNAGAVASALYPIDIDPTLSLTLHGLYRLARDLGMYVDVKSVVREIYDLISRWPEYMIDNMKLWYEIFKEGVSDFFIPFSSINPSFGGRYVKQKIREMEHLGLRGVFVSPTLQFFNPATSPAFKQLMEYAEKNNVLVIMHLGMPRDVDERVVTHIMPKNLMEILEEYRPYMVISGLGTSPDRFNLWVREVLRVMRKYDNTYLSTPGINCYLFNDESARPVLNTLGPERILFGSGYPYRRFRDLMSDVKCIEGSDGISNVDKEVIMMNNAIDLFKYHGFRINENLST